MAKKIQFNIEARDGLKRGVDALADAVKVKKIKENYTKKKHIK
jgi:hypothetical protein